MNAAAGLSAIINAAGAGGLGGGANSAAAAGLYGQAAALAGLTPQHPANAASHGLPSGLASLFSAQRHHPSLSLNGQHGGANFASAGAGERKASADLANLYPFGFLSSNSPGRSSSSGSSDMDGATLARGQSSTTAVSSPDIQHATTATNQILASLTAANVNSNVDGTAIIPKSPGQSSHSGSSIGNGGTSPMPAYATASADMFAGVPTTKDVRHGQSVAPQISTSGDAPGIRKQMVLLKAAAPLVKEEPPADDEEVDELEDDVDGDAVMQSRSPSPTPTESTVHSQYPMRTLPPIQPSEKTSYPSLFSSRSSPPPADPTSVKLPSAASLISQADEIANLSRRASSTRYSSEETEGRQTPPARYPSLSPGTPGKRPSPSGHETVLPGIASLALDLPNRSNSKSPSLKPGEERVKHLAIIEALLQWVNSEYVKQHGDPWVAAERKAKEEKEKEQRVGMLRAASVSPPSIMKDEDDSDESEESDDDDSFESEDELSVGPPQASQPVHRMMDVEMVA
ncbi:hypothetical protein M407DRAFT_199132 [Tulasnella calospora MUT 4182]|uniref:Uncharacterized protein n=1 Tax=Tulasnella calospora MUT 4182 TaxID=1051891 RepID=A0A0C3MI76_9AGAM|nr:hypothetical protein M407DRAFT_199132 [Tulasnella calospora MUT 4182]